ncbi:hypothetical protein [Luteibacter sp. RCC_6_2]|uniref:hypothetical protein n=1 Tax=Luteibacter sp. RCC_6_2 TaxID=3239223 RepID=UPI0035245E9D
MYTLTINLTKTLVADWAFSNQSDFERAGTAARVALTARPMVDVGDLQALMDATLAPFDEEPAAGEITFDLHGLPVMASAVAV